MLRRGQCFCVDRLHELLNGVQIFYRDRPKDTAFPRLVVGIRSVKHRKQTRLFVAVNRGRNPLKNRGAKVGPDRTRSQAFSGFSDITRERVQVESLECLSVQRNGTAAVEGATIRKKFGLCEADTLQRGLQVQIGSELGGVVLKRCAYRAALQSTLRPPHGREGSGEVFRALESSRFGERLFDLRLATRDFDRIGGPLPLHLPRGRPSEKRQGEDRRSQEHGKPPPFSFGPCFRERVDTVDFRLPGPRHNGFFVRGNPVGQQACISQPLIWIRRQARSHQLLQLGVCFAPV